MRLWEVTGQGERGIQGDAHISGAAIPGKGNPRAVGLEGDR